MFNLVQILILFSITLNRCYSLKSDTKSIIDTYKSSINDSFNIGFVEDKKKKILVNSIRSLNITISHSNERDYPYLVEFKIDDSSIAALIHNDGLLPNPDSLLHTVEFDPNNNNRTFMIYYRGIFIGRTKLRVNILNPDDTHNPIKDDTFPLVVVRQNGMIVDLFIGISGIFILFINIGKFIFRKYCNILIISEI